MATFSPASIQHTHFGFQWRKSFTYFMISARLAQVRQVHSLIRELWTSSCIYAFPPAQQPTDWHWKLKVRTGVCRGQNWWALLLHHWECGQAGGRTSGCCCLGPIRFTVDLPAWAFSPSCCTCMDRHPRGCLDFHLATPIYIPVCWWSLHLQPIWDDLLKE